MGVLTTAIVGQLVERGAGREIVAAVIKALFWNLALMMYGYDAARRESLRRVTGIGVQLFERLVRLSASDIYAEFSRIVGET